MKFSNRSDDGPAQVGAGMEGEAEQTNRHLNHEARARTDCRKRRVTGVRKIVVRKPTAKALLATGIHSVQ